MTLKIGVLGAGSMGGGIAPSCSERYRGTSPRASICCIILFIMPL